MTHLMPAISLQSAAAYDIMAPDEEAGPNGGSVHMPVIWAKYRPTDSSGKLTHFGI